MSKTKIIPTTGTNNCGGRCLIQAHVKDGKITRLSYDPSSNPKLRPCPRFTGYLGTNFHPDRLKYPLKRIGKRGEGKFERISWDEAIDTIVNQMIRIKKEYGPGSRYVHYSTGISGYLRGREMFKRLLNLDGGFLDYYNSYSTAATAAITPSVYGTNMSGNSLEDILNSKLIVLWGHNPLVTRFGLTHYYLKKAKEKGIPIVSIDPRRSHSTKMLADQWIPIRPGTDNALAEAMSYVMITENLLDEEYINKYIEGYDNLKEEDGKINYKSYILGKNDRIPKDPSWASKITGIDPSTITELARRYATAKPAAILQGWGPQRNLNGEDIVRGVAVLCAITGNVGVSGGSAGGAGYNHVHSGPAFPIGDNPYGASIPVYRYLDAITDGTNLTKDDGIKGRESLDSSIKMIVNLAGNALVNQHGDHNRTHQILVDESKVEFILVSDILMTSSSKYADILLPGDNMFERNNIAGPWFSGEYLMYANKVVEPPEECKNEYYWISEVAKRLGLYEEFTEGNKTPEDWLRRAVDELRERYPEFPSYEEFKARGYYEYQDWDIHVAFKKQIENPDKYKFPTKSGKIEIYSQNLADMNNEDIPALPVYRVVKEGYEDSLREKYPIQLIGHHSIRRTHSIHDNNPHMEKVEPHCIYINTEDAIKRGISDKDKVLVYNDRGTVRIRAKVTDDIAKGVASIPQGAWYTPDDKGVDTRGSVNTLTNLRYTPYAKGNAQHTALVEIEKHM